MGSAGVFQWNESAKKGSFILSISLKLIGHAQAEPAHGNLDIDFEHENVDGAELLAFSGDLSRYVFVYRVNGIFIF